jgi:hypothetical protein
MGGGVEAEIADVEDGWALRCTPSCKRAQPRVQLGEREGLREVVVGAGVETDDAIVDAVARRQ